MNRLLAVVASVAVISSPSAVWLAPDALAAAVTPGSYFAYANGAAPDPSSCLQATSPASQCTLTQALALNSAAGGGGTVYLATPGADGHYYGNWVVDADVVIEPAAGVADPTLDGDEGGDGEDEGSLCTTDGCGGPILSNTASQLTVDGVTFTHGSSEQAGAILNTGAGEDDFPHLTVTNSTFEDNQGYAGGAIGNGGGGPLGAAATITSSTFADNDAGVTGGAIANTGSLTVKTSTFYDNVADSGAGNDLLTASVSDEPPATATIIGSTFSDGVETREGTSIATEVGPLSGGSVSVAGDLFALSCDTGGADWTDLGYNAATTADTSNGKSCLAPPTEPKFSRARATSHVVLGNGDVVDDGVADVSDLADNGGPTATVLPNAENPAIASIPDPTSVDPGALCPRTDQRGYTSSGACTAGSVEPNGTAPGGDGGGGGGRGGGGGGGGRSPITPIVTVVSDNNPASAGEDVTFTATLSPIPPCGTVLWQIDNAPASGVPTSGSATSGTATLGPDSALPEGTHSVTAVYSGCSGYPAANGSVVQEVDEPSDTPPGDQTGPTIEAHVTSAHRRHNGWYRSPVHISFTCAAGTAPLTGPCPDPVVLREDGKGQVVTRTIEDSDGRTASATRHINLDQMKPRVDVAGVTDGHTYDHKPTLTCKATDALSGVASCRIHRHRHKHADGTTTVRYVGVARDVAGNTSKTRGSYTLS